MLIETKDLSFTYMPGTPFQVEALQHVNISIGQGEFIGIIGETGSGKSTLVQHFNGLLKPTSGQILVEGKDIWAGETDLRALRSRISMLFQFPEHQLFEETVFKDVSFGPRNLGLNGNELVERVRFGLESMGLDYNSYKDRSPFQLSGGEKRRVAMAGILAMRPQVIVLDEPTAGMDPVGRKQLLECVQRLHREEKLTVILVTHNMEEVSRLAGRLFVFCRGRLVLQGSPAEVFKAAAPLRETGLEIPALSELMLRLQERGKDVRTGLFSVEEVAAEIQRLFREGRL